MRARRTDRRGVQIERGSPDCSAGRTRIGHRVARHCAPSLDRLALLTSNLLKVLGRLEQRCATGHSRRVTYNTMPGALTPCMPWTVCRLYGCRLMAFAQVGRQAEGSVGDRVVR